MLSFFLMCLNGWAAWSCSNTIAQRKQLGLKSPWYLHGLGAANVFFCVFNFMLFLDA